MPIVAAHEPIRAKDILEPTDRRGSVAASTSASERARHLSVALITQITRPFRFHVASILGASLATDDDPIDAAPKPGPEVKRLKLMVRQTANAHGRVHARGWGTRRASDHVFHRRT